MPPPGYPMPGQPGNPQWAPSPSPSASGMAIAGLVLGVVGILTCWLCGLGAVLGVIGVVLAAVALSRSNRLPGRPDRGLAIAGVVTNVLAIIAGVVIVAVLIASAEPINSDPADGYCNEDRWLQDPDC